MTLDDPRVVREEYASERDLEARRSIYLDEGPSALDVAFAAVAEVRPGRVLEVGCGPGEFARRLVDELGVELVAIDLSPRMVELARGRGIDVRLGDVQKLPFVDDSFDCAVANWMLYHLPDLDRGLRELARVLRPAGRLVAATNSERHLEELWLLTGERVGPGRPFRAEDGGGALLRHFAHVERRDFEREVVLADYAAARAYIERSIVSKHLAIRLARFEGPLRTRARVGVFVAETAPA